MGNEEDENKAIEVLKLDRRFIDSWLAMLVVALGKTYAGENVWVMNPNLILDEGMDLESLATVHAILGIWEWNLIEMEHEHRGVLGDITTVQKVMVVNMHENSKKGQLRSSDQAIDFEIQDDFTPQLVSV